MRKNSIITRIAAVATAGLMAFAVAGCGSGDESSDTDTGANDSGGKISVIASINQWGSVAEELGGDNVEVTNIMSNTNVEAHEYEPSTQDIAKFGDAKIVVVNGADYDPWASKAAESTDATLIDAAETGGIAEGENPHVWFSADVRSKTADAITKAYEDADPDNKDSYSELNDTWHEQEDELEQKITDASSKTQDLPYAATESVAWYLADDLKMKDVTPQGYQQASANESEPTPADIKEFQDALADGSIKLLVYNSQEADSVTDQITEAAKSADVPIVELTEQMPEEYDTLTDWMGALVDEFADAV